MEDRVHIRDLPMVTIRLTRQERRQLRKAAAVVEAQSLQQWAREVLLQSAERALAAVSGAAAKG